MGGRYGGDIGGRGRRPAFKIARDVAEAIGRSTRRLPLRAAKGIDQLTAPGKPSE